MEHGTPIKRHSNSTRQRDRLAPDTYKDTAKLKRGGSNPSITDDISKYLRMAQIINAGDLNEKLLGAARDPSGNGGGGHDDIVRILNSISLCFVETLNPQASTKTKAIIFVSTPAMPIREDDMNTDIRPDWYAYMTTYEVLIASVRHNAPPPRGSYYSIIGIGEQISGGSEPDGKVMHYLQVLYQYRYDLQTVYGFQYDHIAHKGRHWAFNACGWAQSDWLNSNPAPAPAPTTNASVPKGKRKADIPGDPLSPWVQHVLFLYSSDYFRIGHITRGDHVGVNIWAVDGKTFIVVPFHTSSGPGRMTVVFLILADRTAKVIAGILKRQWRDKRGRFVEGNLMVFAQSSWWFPCFPTPRYVGPTTTYEISQRSSSDIERQLALLEMKTLGSPLTSCEDTTELLMVAFDAILAHWLLYKKRGILHRDVSDNNVLRKPKHLLREEELRSNKEREQEFRKPIMEVLGRSKGEWCALLTDFDQAVKYDEWKGDGHQKRLERTGTPMFIAIEKSSTKKVSVPERAFPPLETLSGALMNAEVLDPARFKLAFPCSNENETFNKNWSAVLKREKDIKLVAVPGVKLDPMNEHQAYHDVESFFWVFLWTFARAQPQNSRSALGSTYNTFCHTMLHHKIQDAEDIEEMEELEDIEDIEDVGEIENKDSRSPYLFNLKAYMPDILHPRLRRFSKLFLNMAEYLSIPWSRYEDLNLPDDHTHLAMLRLLLGAILTEIKLGKPIPLAKKIRYFDPAFASKEVRPNTKSKSKSQSIPYTQAAELGTIPENANTQSPESNPVCAGAAKPSSTPSNDNTDFASSGPPSCAGDDSGDASNSTPLEKTLEPLPKDPQEFLDLYGVFEHRLTSALPDKDLGKTSAPGREPSNSAEPSVDNETPVIDGNAQRLGNKRQAQLMDKTLGERPSKKSKSAE